MNSQVFGTKFSGSRNEGSTATVQETQPQGSRLCEAESINTYFGRSHRCENVLINDFIVHEVPATIYLVNGYQEHAVIRDHDGKVIITINPSASNLIYKHGISTIERDKSSKAVSRAQEAVAKLKELKIFQHTIGPCAPLEQWWLDDLIRNRCHVNLVTIGGYPEHGIITDYDSEVVVFVRYDGDDPRIIYKHFLSTISMKRK